MPSFAKGNPEGYLFPATYDVQPNTPPITVLRGMVTRFGQEAASVSLPAAAAHAELTQAEVIIIASLIQAEGKASGLPEGRPGDLQPAQRQPPGPAPARQHRDVRAAHPRHPRHLAADQGEVALQHLPARRPAAGPDRQPGDAAIRAALHPAKGTWTYFVTVNPKTGLTKFTSSFAQFQRYEAELTANLAKGR